LAGYPRQPVTVINLDCPGDVPASDEELLARQAALQKEARQLLAALDLAALVADIGPLLLAGSFVSPDFYQTSAHLPGSLILIGLSGGQPGRMDGAGDAWRSSFVCPRS
jgi:hypothetical protein